MPSSSLEWILQWSYKPQKIWVCNGNADRLLTLPAEVLPEWFSMLCKGHFTVFYFPPVKTTGPISEGGAFE